MMEILPTCCFILVVYDAILRNSYVSVGRFKNLRVFSRPAYGLINSLIGLVFNLSMF